MTNEQKDLLKTKQKLIHQLDHAILHAQTAETILLNPLTLEIYGTEWVKITLRKVKALATIGTTPTSQYQLELEKHRASISLIKRKKRNSRPELSEEPPI